MTMIESEPLELILQAPDDIYWIAYQMAKDSGETVLVSEWVSRV